MGPVVCLFFMLSGVLRDPTTFFAIRLVTAFKPNPPSFARIQVTC